MNIATDRSQSGKLFFYVGDKVIEPLFVHPLS